MKETTNFLLYTCILNDNHKALENMHKENPKILNMPITALACDNEHPIHVAAKNGATKCIQYMVKNGIYINKRRRYDRFTPLHLACSRGHFNTMVWLLENGANPNARSHFKHTPLITAVISLPSEDEKIKACEILLSHGANPKLFGDFRKGAYGSKEEGNGVFEDPTIGLTARYIARYKNEQKLLAFLNKAVQKWEHEHSVKGYILKGLSILGQLMPAKKEKTNIAQRRLLSKDIER